MVVLSDTDERDNNYFSDVYVLANNCLQNITTVVADKDFVASNSVALSGILSTFVHANMKEAKLLLVGHVINKFAGVNQIDCTNPAHNQWQMNINGGSYSDLIPDGQMNDADWVIPIEGGGVGFSFIFDITSEFGNIVTDKIGIKLENGIVSQNSMDVVLDVVAIRLMWLK